tara:strand:+ start:757 stop:1071 length:315 start_codon:yes stop_codon:yes gene_type:complete
MNIFLIVLLFLVSCGRIQETPKWTEALETLKPIEGYVQAGIFSHSSPKNLKPYFYVQYCDSKGNQLWMKYNYEDKSWIPGKYNTWGCKDSTYSTGPDDDGPILN